MLPHNKSQQNHIIVSILYTKDIAYYHIHHLFKLKGGEGVLGGGGRLKKRRALLQVLTINKGQSSHSETEQKDTITITDRINAVQTVAVFSSQQNA